MVVVFRSLAVFFRRPCREGWEALFAHSDDIMFTSCTYKLGCLVRVTIEEEIEGRWY